MIDFASSRVGTKILTDAASADGYDVSNLISDDFSLRNSGFIAEHFVKPPLFITLSFPCAINIFQIIFEPFKGKQQVCNVEILSASKTVDDDLKQCKDLEKWSEYQNDSCKDLLFCRIASLVIVEKESPVCFYTNPSPTKANPAVLPATHYRWHLI